MPVLPSVPVFAAFLKTSNFHNKENPGFNRPGFLHALLKCR